MRKVLMMLLCSVSITVSAVDYFVSSSGSDSSNGLSTSSPWKTIAKVNAEFYRLNPGDRILFKRGDLFYGGLVISGSGASGNPITLSAYGTGPAPVISGFSTISGWTNYGGGIYYRALSCESSPNMVTVDGKNTPIGRWPNTGFLSIDSYVSNTSIYDASLPSSPNWTGAEVVIRKNMYIWDRNKITNHSGNNLSYTGGSFYDATDGNGYFIQNDIKTLDQSGEWYYNGTNFYMYFGSADPNNYEVKVSIRDQLVYIDGKNFITLDNLSLEGANVYGVQVRNSDFITIQNCNISFTGGTAIFGPWWVTSPGCKITNTTINHSNNIGIKLHGDHVNAIITNNKVLNTGLIIGMGGSGDGNYIGIFISGDGSLIQYNSVENTGYTGIYFGGDNTLITNNFVNNFNLVKNDGAGIYTYVGTGTPSFGQKVMNNIVTNGLGYSEGLESPIWDAFGIYMDDRTENVEISGNSVSNCSRAGIFLHNAHEINVKNNTLFNNGGGNNDSGSQIIFVHDGYSPDDPIRNVALNNNIFFAKTTTQKIFAFSTPKTDIPQFGTSDYNCFAKPIDNTYATRTWDKGWYGPAINRTLEEWRSYSGKDANSFKSPISISDVNKIRFEYNASASNKVVALDGGYIDVYGTKYSGSITLQPYTSAVLIVDPNPSAAPTSPVFVSASVENITPSVVEMAYNLSLTGIIPAASAFSVNVNSVARNINTVAISGTRVLLTLASPLATGDVVTVAYTKPATNPLQTASGGQAATLSAQSVTNRVSPIIVAVPVYRNSAIGNDTPARIDVVYDLDLINNSPPVSAFNVRVNSVARNINKVTVVSNVVLITLASPVAFGDVVTLSYTKPATNPLQTASGGQAASIGTQPVTNKIAPPLPVYLSSSIEILTPARLDMTYNMNLANIAPVASSFSVRVNSIARTVNSVAISGTKVFLTLASQVTSGDLVTVAYTKPAANPLQTIAGGQAITISAQSVTNRVSPSIPAYVSSSIENATPARLDISFNMTLANIVPLTSAFTVLVNSAARTVTAVAVSGTRVLLTLASPVTYNQTVTVAYTKPASNPLQSTSGGQVLTFSAKSVTNNLSAPPSIPVYVSSVIENATPTRLEMTYNQTLANIVPAASAFTVRVNSIARTVTGVNISGTKVLLTLSAAIKYGESVTVAYIMPATNPLQTAAGGKAVTLTAQTVTNRLVAPPAIPVYSSSVIENTTPSRMDITYNSTLANIVPAAAAYTVKVNSVTRSVTNVTISGTKVLLTLASPVAFGDIVTVAYTKPSTNPLQSPTGGQVATMAAQNVTNRAGDTNAAPVIVVSYQNNIYAGFVNELNASGSYDINNDNLTFTWTAPGGVAVSSSTGSKIQYLSPIVSESKTVQFTLKISDGKTTQTKVIPVTILPYQPELEVAEVVNIEASGFLSPNYPYNILDGNIGTMWSVNGDNQWLILELKEPFNVQHVKLAFQPGQKREAYFDILGSDNKVNWEPILTKSASCSFSGDLQVFDFPSSKSSKDYKYIQLVGRTNSIDAWNYISEFRIFGYRHKNPSNYEEQVMKIYPNPASDYVKVRLEETTLVPDFIKIISLGGKVMYHEQVQPGVRELEIPLDLQQGIYIVQMGTGNLTLFTQKLIVSR